jgi:hypothetical protein
MRIDRSTWLISACAALAAGLVVAWLRRPALAPDVARPIAVEASEAAGASATLGYEPSPIGAPAADFGRPLVTHVQIVDLDQDGLADVLYCEASKHTVRWIRQAPRGTFTETVIGESILAPVHVWAGDVNGSGRRDVLVASMGQLMPSNDRIGSLVALENLDNRTFRRRVLLERTARVTDARGANLSGHLDGRLDLVVGQFGYAQGETRWMRNRGGWNFESEIVNTLSGCVHTPVADFDGDGRGDFAALISQEWEEVYVFRNRGADGFQSQIAWGSTTEDYGSSGMDVADVNRDGRPDLIYTNGDGFDYPVPGGRPWHGIQWLENRGAGKFVFHRVGQFPGAYSPNAADLDGDGDIDLLAVSCFADWRNPKAVSMMAWLNDGMQNFRPVVLAHTPTHLVTAAVGDLDGDNVAEIVTGGLHAFPPYENLGSVTLWRRK